MHPVITFLKERKKRVSNIEYLAVKEKEGKLREDEGFLSAAGDLAKLTANTGKDMYLASAKCVFFVNNVSTNHGSAGDKVVLKINGVIKETARFSFLHSGTGTTSGGTTLYGYYEFKNIGQKVAAGQIIKIEVITLDVDVDVEGYVQCFEEDTGTDPRL